MGSNANLRAAWVRSFSPFSALAGLASMLLWIAICSPTLLAAEKVEQAESSAKGVKVSERVEPHPLSGLNYRNIGPVNMSGRVADVEGIPGDPRILYVGSASGGVWKTLNGGVTFEPIFDDQPVSSIGDIALAPSNREVIYVGTGEGNPRNSVSFGQGVFKSTDGGETWSHLGLEDSRYITRIAVHPRDPDTVWVGALGSIFGPGETRGVFKTTDGGLTWRKVLYLDSQHGVADLDLDPQNPNVIFAGMWHFDRKPWTHTSGSEQGGLFRSVDGGETWEKVEQGLPKLMGRLGVKVAPSDPRIVYVIAESNEGTLFRSQDRGKTFEKVHDEARIVSRGLYYTDLRVDPADANKVFAISSRLFQSIDGGKTFERISKTTHVDYHSLWIDPQDPKRMWQGQDGGIAVSWDGGQTWDPVRNLPIAQFYQVFYDLRSPFYHLGGGLQDNGTWVGPSRTREPAGILPDDWRLTSFGDAYFVVPHAHLVGLYLSEYQGGGIVRYDETTRRQVEVNPQTRRADGGPVESLAYRFNWNAPIVASPHDPEKVYFAGNVIFETRDFGTAWTQISPDLTTDDPEKQKQAGGPVWFENTTAEYHCTIISFAESPAAEGVLWVGTDDGKLQLSRDAGASWVDLTSNLDVPSFSPVSHVEPSRIDSAIAYVSFDRHMFDDFRPHLFKTMDFGRTWTRLGRGLPQEGWLWVVREDPRNPEVVYAGSEVGLFVSFNGGGDWQEADFGDLPSVAVHDVLIHPESNDLIVGTHGRAIWVLDDLSPIQQWTAAQKEEAFLFDVRPALRFPMDPSRYGQGDRVWVAENPPFGALITYFLGQDLEPPKGVEDTPGDGQGGDPEEPGETQTPELTLEILDSDGRVVRTLEDLPTTRGVHRLAWDLAEDGPEQRSDEEEAAEFGGSPRGARVLPGRYVARLSAAGEVLETPIQVEVDPLISVDLEALSAQQSLARRLVALYSRTQRLLQAMDQTVAELESRRQSILKRRKGIQNKKAQNKKAHDKGPGELLLSDVLPEGVAKAWREVEEEIQRQMDLLARPEGKPFWSEGPRLENHLQSLFQNVDSALAAPTRAQLDFGDELADAVKEAVDAWNGLLRGELAALEQSLSGEGQGFLVLPEPLIE